MLQVGMLDQGFFPDGLYTPPTDEAMRFDLDMAKSLGYNMLRKHIKVEPDRWYRYADEIGILIWQVTSNAPSPSQSCLFLPFHTFQAPELSRHAGQMSIPREHLLCATQS